MWNGKPGKHTATNGKGCCAEMGSGDSRWDPEGDRRGIGPANTEGLPRKESPDNLTAIASLRGDNGGGEGLPGRAGVGAPTHEENYAKQAQQFKG